MNTNWLIGAGPMAIDYAKVLKALGKQFVTIGRGEGSATHFKAEVGEEVIQGGLGSFLSTNPAKPEYAIVALSIENLAESCIQLLDFGVKNILLEKPGVGYADEIELLAEKAAHYGANVLLAYNRHFYASVLKAAEIIKVDGCVSSFHFEFTEWSHQIRNLKKHKTELQNWFLGNSTHVIDTAFYLCGKPKEISCYHKGGTDWHPKSTIHAGAGISETGALFSYDANWEAPGRWNIDIMTAKHRLIFKPMEKLQIMKIGSVAIEYVENMDYNLDEQFKPGLYLQLKNFLEDNFSQFTSIQKQKDIMAVYRKMSGY